MALFGDSNVVNPITNDRISPQGSSANSTSNEQRVERELASNTAAVESADAPKPTGETVEVSAAGQLLNQPPVAAGGAASDIETTGEAIDLVGRLRKQIDQNATQAVSAHGGLNQEQLSAILNAAPA
ncbi:MAG: hypothetical protein ABW116_18480 [Candidatus Sedimenticola sp. 20ELBAFRAG]